MKSFWAGLAAILLSMHALAGEAEIRKAFASRFTDAKVVSVAKSPMEGLFEVVVDGGQGKQVVYSDAKGNFMLMGEMLDLRSMRRLTSERMEVLNAIRFDTLPLQHAIKIVKGNGKRRLAVFSDPDCPHCRRLQAELAKLDDVSLYMFPLPLDMHPDAGRKAALAWCAKDRARAWEDLMLRDRLPEGGSAKCSTPIDTVRALAQRLGIDGTPTLVFANGRRVASFLDAATLEKLVAMSEAKPAK